MMTGFCRSVPVFFRLLVFVIACFSSANAAERQIRSSNSGYRPVESKTAKDWAQASLNRACIPEAIYPAPRMPSPRDEGKRGAYVSFIAGYVVCGCCSALEKEATPGDKANLPTPIFLHSQICNKNVNCMKSGSNTGIFQVAGDTDDVGTTLHDQQLSQRRAGASSIVSPPFTALRAGA